MPLSVHWIELFDRQIHAQSLGIIVFGRTDRRREISALALLATKAKIRESGSTIFIVVVC